MSEPQQLHIVKSKHEQVSGTVASLAFIALTYYSFKPEALEQHMAALRKWWQSAQFTFSVWQVRCEIRSLPEADVTHVTRNK